MLKKNHTKYLYLFCSKDYLYWAKKNTFKMIPRHSGPILYTKWGGGECSRDGTYKNGFLNISLVKLLFGFYTMENGQFQTFFYHFCKNHRSF